MHMDQLDVTRYIICEKFDEIIPRTEKVLENFTGYYRDMMKSVPMDNIIENRRNMLKQELKKIECNSHLM